MGFADVIAGKMQQESERVERARAEFNYKSVQSWISQGSKVLDVGAWACYLGEMLRDRKRCDVLSLDVIDVNKTGMPFQKFDGRNLPVEDRSYDVVLLLYVLHHAADDEPLLREAGRVLRDRGLLLVAEDCVDTLWDKILTEGFHIWLWLVARMTRDGKFRTGNQWQARFPETGFHVRETISLGHHLGRFLWPNNVLYVLEKESAGHTAGTPSPKVSSRNFRNSSPLS